MRIGVTGASGFVGGALIRNAEAQGHKIVAFTRHMHRRIPGVWDVRDFSDPSRIDLKGIDALVHLAGEPILGPWSEKKKREIRESRLSSTRQIVKALNNTRRRPSVFVCASAVGLYGDRGNEILEEESDPGFGFLAEVARDWESEAWQATKTGVRVVSARFPMVLGSRGGAMPLLTKLFRKCLGGKLGNGKQWMSWVHVDDLCKMIFHVLENEDYQGPINFTAPNPVRNAEFTRTLARLLKRPALLPAPAAMIRMVVGDMADMLLFSQRVEPTVLRTTGYQWLYPELKGAMANLLEFPAASPEPAKAPEKATDEEPVPAAKESGTGN